MAKIISVWSGPRNISTALMYSFSRRSDMRVVDEPLYAHYLLRTGVNHPGRQEVIDSMEADPERIWKKYKDEAAVKHVFLKNMAHHAIDLPEEWFTGPIPLFLIRDPHDMLPSLGRVLENPVLRDTGLDKQLEMVHTLQAAGREVLVVEGADILKDPPGMLRILCERLEIIFEENMLSWPAGPLPEDGVWARYWYEQVHRSTGFNPWKPAVRDIPDRLKPLLDQCQPYYAELKNLKISP